MQDSRSASRSRDKKQMSGRTADMGAFIVCNGSRREAFKVLAFFTPSRPPLVYGSNL
jgi:hypothetical protein